MNRHGGLILLLTGIACIVIGIVVFNKTNEFKKHADPVTAVVTAVEVTGSGDDTDHTAYVSYEYKGEKYENIRLSEYSSKMKKGAKIQLYVDRKNPSKAKSVGTNKTMSIIFMALGGFVTLIGVVTVIRRGL